MDEQQLKCFQCGKALFINTRAKLEHNGRKHREIVESKNSTLCEQCLTIYPTKADVIDHADKDHQGGGAGAGGAGAGAGGAGAGQGGVGAAVAGEADAAEG